MFMCICVYVYMCICTQARDCRAARLYVRKVVSHVGLKEARPSLRINFCPWERLMSIYLIGNVAAYGPYTLLRM